MPRIVIVQRPGKALRGQPWITSTWSGGWTHPLGSSIDVTDGHHPAFGRARHGQFS
ncbi:MAG: hypothetical protein ABSC41_03775 [Acidimicrobiales bacterium]